MTKKKVSVVVVDDTPHVRQMLADMLDLDGFDVVGQASNGADAIEVVIATKPEVVVIDYAMPEMNGLDAGKKILEAIPGQPIILYTAYIDDKIRSDSKEAGIALCIGKIEGVESLERSISELVMRIGKR